METLLQGIPHVTVYIDDILVTGETEEDHLQTLEKVLEWLAKAGLRARESKCNFMVPSVDFLGYVIDAQGLHPHPAKVSAIQHAPTPTDVTQLKSYLGLLYYGRFLSNLSSSVVQAVAKGFSLGVVIGSRSSLPELKGMAHLFKVTRSLQPTAPTTIGM